MILSPIDTGIIVIYFIAMIGIGIAVMRRASKNLDSYFLGGHSMPWWVLGLSNASAMWDITGTMWFVAMLFTYGLKAAWIPWIWPLFDRVFRQVYLGAWIRRSNVLTGAEWMRTRFGTGVGGSLSHISVVIYALVLSIGFLAVATLVLTAANNNSNGNRLTEANMLARQTLEQLKNTPVIADLEEGTSTEADIKASGEPGGIFTRTTKIKDLLGFDTSRAIEVTVSWSWRGKNHNIVMNTITKGKGI